MVTLFGSSAWAASMAVRARSRGVDIVGGGSGWLWELEKCCAVLRCVREGEVRHFVWCQIG